MKLACLRDGSLTGLLVVVSSDLSRCTPAASAAGSLDEALRDWLYVAPGLATLAAALEIGAVDVWRFHPSQTQASVPADPALQPETGRGADWCGPADPWIVPPGTSDLSVALAPFELRPAGHRRPVLHGLACVGSAGAQPPSFFASAPVLVCAETWRRHRASGLTGRLSVIAAAGTSVEARAVLHGDGGQDGPPTLSASLGDRFRLAVYDARRHSVLGAIEAHVEPPAPRLRPLDAPYVGQPV